MTHPIFPMIDATWPAASARPGAGWTIREGQGGGSRVSAATWDGTGSPDIRQAETAMRDLGQRPLFMIRDGDEALDRALEARGYTIKDPTIGFAIDPALIAEYPPPVTSFTIWPPLAIQAEIWATGGIGPERLAIMGRAEGPKTTIFGRINDKPAGAGFVAMHGNSAMLHALEVAEPFRRHGLGRIMMRHAAAWAQDMGAGTLNLLVTRANPPALNLYTSLGFQPVGNYHYRQNLSEAE